MPGTSRVMTIAETSNDWSRMKKRTIREKDHDYHDKVN